MTTDQDESMLFETAAAKMIGTSVGVVLLFAGSAGLGSYALEFVGLVQDGAGAVAESPMEFIERVVPNFALGAMGMWLIFKMGVQKQAEQIKATQEVGRQQVHSLERLGDRIEKALAETIHSHRQIDATHRTTMEAELRQIRESLAALSGGLSAT